MQPLVAKFDVDDVQGDRLAAAEHEVVAVDRIEPVVRGDFLLIAGGCPFIVSQGTPRCFLEYKAIKLPIRVEVEVVEEALIKARLAAASTIAEILIRSTGKSRMCESDE